MNNYFDSITGMSDPSQFWKGKEYNRTELMDFLRKCFQTFQKLIQSEPPEKHEQILNDLFKIINRIPMHSADIAIMTLAEIIEFYNNKKIHVPLLTVDGYKECCQRYGEFIFNVIKGIKGD